MFERQLKYAVIGTGGIGGYYGGRLAQSGKDVHFLFRSDFEAVKKQGLIVDSVKGDFVLQQVNAYNSVHSMPKADVVLVCMKTTSNHLLGEMLAPLLGADSVIILIQNGLCMESELSSALPGANIAGATAFVCSSKIAPAHIHHAQYGELTIAPFGDCPVDVLKQVCNDFEQSNIPAHFSDNLNLIRWKKLVWNIPYNGLSVVLKASTDALTETPSSCELLKMLMADVLKGAAACGVQIKEKYIDQMLDFTRVMTPYLPSMRLDFDARRPMEIRTMYENPCRVARQAGAPMEHVETLMQQLYFLESVNLSNIAE